MNRTAQRPKSGRSWIRLDKKRLEVEALRKKMIVRNTRPEVWYKWPSDFIPLDLARNSESTVRFCLNLCNPNGPDPIQEFDGHKPAFSKLKIQFQIENVVFLVIPSVGKIKIYKIISVLPI